ncbi:hypothetical protein BJ508DRAFT_324614 [Ascobolus immersus RN42]|uniref:Uncharacterized protein n=1 Tax=Ascobolus immersus RN42 TaxID=1160509 RepID=A0A3N4ICY5_ASCIM|nr:hypothetical protein BJ508DRAFT_324614 [Ascobolus immersus RN42]
MTAAAELEHNLFGRPVLPLPKRRLRSRLPGDDSVPLFSPPRPQNPAPLFYFPFHSYTENCDTGTATTDPAVASEYHHDGISGGDLMDHSDEEDRSSVSFSNADANSRGKGYDMHLRDVNGDGGPGRELLPSESYGEWAENTNNKKKRKIPTSMVTGGGGMVMGGGGPGTTTSHSPGFSPTGPSGSSRNRWKSSGPGQRSPLAVVSGGHQIIRRLPRRPPIEFTKRISGRLFPQAEHNEKENLEYAEDIPRRMENVQRSPEHIPKPPETPNFTFEYPSAVAKNLPHAATPLPAHHQSGYQKTVGTQTSPSIANNYSQYTNGQAPPQTAPKPKARRRPARPRKYYSNGPPNANGETWICEFCEYESIFGEPPEALMRQYDIKDRKERRRLANQRRLLEKAKQKARKGRTSSKQKSNAQAANNNSAQPPAPAPSTTDSQGTQSDNSHPTTCTMPHPPSKEPQIHGDRSCPAIDHHESNGRGANGGSQPGANGGGTNGSGGGGGARA